MAMDAEQLASQLEAYIAKFKRKEINEETFVETLKAMVSPIAELKPKHHPIGHLTLAGSAKGLLIPSVDYDPKTPSFPMADLGYFNSLPTAYFEGACRHVNVENGIRKELYTFAEQITTTGDLLKLAGAGMQARAQNPYGSIRNSNLHFDEHTSPAVKKIFPSVIYGMTVQHPFSPINQMGGITRMTLRDYRKREKSMVPLDSIVELTEYHQACIQINNLAVGFRTYIITHDRLSGAELDPKYIQYCIEDIDCRTISEMTLDELNSCGITGMPGAPDDDYDRTFDVRRENLYWRIPINGPFKFEWWFGNYCYHDDPEPVANQNPAIETKVGLWTRVSFNKMSHNTFVTTTVNPPETDPFQPSKMYSLLGVLSEMKGTFDSVEGGYDNDAGGRLSTTDVLYTSFRVIGAFLQKLGETRNSLMGGDVPPFSNRRIEKEQFNDLKHIFFTRETIGKPRNALKYYKVMDVTT